MTRSRSCPFGWYFVAAFFGALIATLLGCGEPFTGTHGPVCRLEPLDTAFVVNAAGDTAQAVALVERCGVLGR